MGDTTTAERVSSALQRFIAPGLRYSQALFEEQLEIHVRRASRWLDLGCGHRVLSEWRAAAEETLVSQVPVAVGLDVDFDAIRRHRSFKHLCLGDIGTLPFKDASFDLVTANMVVEHLHDPAIQFAEVARVLTPGGVFVFHTPNERSYVIAIARLIPERLKRTLAGWLEGRASEDVYPTHYLANRPSTIESIATASGFTVDEIQFICSAPALTPIPPLVIPELLWIRQLQRRPSLAKYRTTLICVLRKNGGSAAAAAAD